MSASVRRRLAVAALVVVVVATAAVILTTRGDGSKVPASAGPPTNTARVERRTLRESEIVSGTFGYEASVPLSHRTAPAEDGTGGGAGGGGDGDGADNGGGAGDDEGGDGGSGPGGSPGGAGGTGGGDPPTGGGAGNGGGTLTSVAAVGKTIDRGGVLYRVDQRPVVLFFGSVPAWRTLRPGLRGRDVRQLQRNLALLGYGPVAEDGVFRDGTAAAVRRWQRALGLRVTGRVPLGTIVFAAGPRRVTKATAVVGSAVNDGSEILQTTSTERLVRIPLDAAKQQLARVGGAVTVTLPNQRKVGGRIVRVGPVTSDGDGGEGGAGGGAPKAKREVLVRLNSDRGMGQLDAAPVSVALTREIRRKVLTVPVTALLATGGGGYALRVVQGTKTATLPVTVGMFSDGLAEVEGRGVREGQSVVIPDEA